jgi:hypothetical protein
VATGVGAVTVTRQVAVWLPSWVVAVMVVVPTDNAVIRPLTTVATVAVLLLHDRVWLVALSGVMVAVSCSVAFTYRVMSVLLSETPVTATSELAITVTVQIAVLLPSAVVAMMVALPMDRAVIKPSTTVAVALLLLHATAWLVALSGVMVAMSCSVAFTDRVVAVLLRVMPVTGMAVDVHFAVSVKLAVTTLEKFHAVEPLYQPSKE